MQTEQLKALIVDALEDVKATNIKVIDVRGRSSITDLIVIATGGSNRQVKAAADNVVKKALENGVRPLGMEGEQVGEWALVDLGDAVIHVMQAQVRDFYNLEKLWGVDEPKGESADGGKA